MAPAIHRLVIVDDGLAVGFRWNHRDGATLVEVRAQPIGVERFIAQQGIEADTGNERSNPDDVVALSRQQDEADEVAQGIDQRDDFARQVATRASDGMLFSPPFAPLAFWWTLTIVPSIMAYSKSGSPDNTWKMCSKISARTQRRKRLNTLFLRPNSPGRSRHGSPARTRHSTASRNSRLSFAVTPRSERLPGNRGAIFCQTVSLMINRSRSITHSLRAKRRLNHSPRPKETLLLSTGPRPIQCMRLPRGAKRNKSRVVRCVGGCAVSTLGRA